jgi:predicted dehydrogenase
MSGPSRILIVSDTDDRARRCALEALARAEPGVTVVHARPGADDLPRPTPSDGVIVDVTSSRLPTDWIAGLEAAVTAGASAVVIAPSLAAAPELSALAGARVTARQPLGEWFAKVPFPGSGATLRLPREFSVVDELSCLEVTGEASVLLAVSVAFADRPVVVERRVGTGRVVAAGLGQDTSAIDHPEIALLLRRCLRPAASERLDSGRPIGLAVLGYGPFGGMGLYHGLAAQATEGISFVAAADSDPGRRKAAEDEFPGLRSYASAADLAADDDVEVVIVATPPTSHFALGIMLLEAGKHVVLEKPMCLTLGEADRLIATSQASRRALTVHQSRRFDADYLAVKRAVDGGVLGDVFNVETFVGGFEHPCRAWHSEESISGGAVYDWGSHHLDWILQLMGGFPATLTAHGHKRVWRDVTNLDQVRVRLGWPDGREAEFLQSDVAGIRRPKFFVQGTAGTLAGHYRPLVTERVEPGVGYVGERAHHAEAPVDLTLARYEPGYGLTETSLPPAVVDRFAFHRNLADHLQLGETLAVTPESTRRVVALLEAAQRSTDDGNVPVPLPDL